MRQVFFDHPLKSGARERVTGERYHHLARVLGFKAGDRLIAAGPDGGRFDAVVREVSPSQVVVALEQALPEIPTGPALELWVAPPKGKAFDQVLDTAAQLGFSRVQPVVTRRTIVRWDADLWRSKAARFGKLLEEGAAQCNRALAPTLSAPLDFGGALKARSAPRVLAYEMSEQKAGAALDSLLTTRPPALALWVGPEGGFDPAEAGQLLAAGAVEISLGPALLRVPVAVAALATRVHAAWERLEA